MPYAIKGKCIYKKLPNGKMGKLVGCTKGSVQKYMAALQANVKEIKLVDIYKDILESKDFLTKNKTK